MQSISKLLLVIGVPLVMLWGLKYLNDRSSYFISFGIIVLAIAAFFLAFERRRAEARELVILAVFCALAVAGRAAFLLIPQFKPMAALVVIAGIALGAQSGFLVGAVSVFVSNFLFGQGPWTPWQMFAMGIMGFVAGIIFHKKVSERERFWSVCIFGTSATILIYGVLVDTSSLLLLYSSNMSLKMWLTVCLSGLPFNVIHGLSTGIFLFFLYRPMMKKIKRIQFKYG